MHLFSEIEIIKDCPSTKEGCLDLGIQEVRVSWDNSHSWCKVNDLNTGEILLHTSNVLGKDFYTNEIIGKRTTIWECEVVQKDSINRPLNVRKIRKVMELPESYHLMQSGFKFIEPAN